MTGILKPAEQTRKEPNKFNWKIGALTSQNLIQRVLICPT